MDRLDGYLANRIKVSNSVQLPIGQTLQPKPPLKYDVYSESTLPLSSSTSSSSRKPYSALPKPSVAQDSRAQRQRRQQEEQLQNEMQKSIARLTLEGEVSDESKEDGDSKGKATNRDDGVFF